MIDWQHLPPLSSLRALAALAEAGSTIEAGARLNVSHAAISQQIKALEAHIGVPLVIRGGRQLALSDEGRQLADAMLGGMSAVEAVIESLSGSHGELSLTVTTTPSFGALWLMPRLADFQAAHPGLSLMLDPTAALRRVGPSGVDLAIRYGDRRDPGCEAELLIRTPIVIVAAPSLVGDSDPVSPADLTAYPWLQELGTNEASEFLSRHGGVLDRARGLSSMPGNLLLDAARDGRGIAVTARAFVEADIAAGRLRLLFEDRRQKGYYLIWNETWLRPMARAFRAWLRQAVERDPLVSVGFVDDT